MHHTFVDGIFLHENKQTKLSMNEIKYELSISNNEFEDKWANIDWLK